MYAYELYTPYYVAPLCKNSMTSVLLDQKTKSMVTFAACSTTFITLSTIELTTVIYLLRYSNLLTGYASQKRTTAAL